MDKEFITKEQLKKIEEYIIENQKPEKEKSSQKRAPDEVSRENDLATTKKRMENEKGVWLLVWFLWLAFGCEADPIR